MGRSALGLGLFLSICLAAAGCNGILDAGEPVVVPPEDTDPPDDGRGGSGGDPDAASCGDGKLQELEQCDDGNDVPDDGCDACVRSCGVKPEILDDSSGHCYRVSEMEALPWEQANLACEAWGGSLVSIESLDELVFVQTRVTVDTWTSARATATGGTFVWLSGEAAVFDPEPEGEGDCIKIRGELLTFAREDCGEELEFVCERGTANP
jgi:cysteine-rich repeat protein